MKTNYYNLRAPLFSLLFFLLSAPMLFAQVPQKMSYQAIIRDASGDLVSNHAIGMKVSILSTSEDGPTVYQEVFNPNPQTNTNGLVTIEIGTGIPVSGSFSTIQWGELSHFVKIETDPLGGTDYSLSHTSQLLSVPYALYADKSGGPQIMIGDWTAMSDFNNSSGVVSTAFNGEINGETRWKTQFSGTHVSENDAVRVDVRMRKQSGEALLTKTVPFDMKINNMVVTFRNWVYDSTTVYYILALKDGNIGDFDAFDFNAWQTAHEVEWRTVVITSGN